MINKNNYIVNTTNIIKNVRTISKVVGGKVKICAIVKADAYGMGMTSVVQALKGEVEYFGVASVVEAMALRVVDKVTPVLILGEVNLNLIDWCAENSVRVTISNLEELDYIESHLNDKVLRIHLAVNTGLNRIGFKSIVAFKRAIEKIKKSNVMTLDGCFTHFATKANDEDFIENQHKKFENFIKLMPNDTIIHDANSYTTLNYKSFYHNMVRPGFAIYGYHKCDYKLLPALTITSEIIHITNVRLGESVGYDRTFVATHNMRVAVVPIGYADGLDRRLSNNFYLLVNGHKANIVGNICMDVVLIDVTYIPYVYVGSKVTILGSDGAEVLTPFDYAKALSTSPYEVLLKFNHKRMNYKVLSE